MREPMRRGVLTALGGVLLALVIVPMGPGGAYADEETADCVATLSKADVSVAYVGDDFHAHVEYTGTGTLCPGVALTVSLNSYSAEGPTWETSGNQVLVDHDQFTIDAEHLSGDLAVTEPPCYYQTDLYWGSTLFDGTDGKAPHYPDTNTPSGLIAHRGGGSACQPPPVDASGSFTMVCDATGAVVTVGTLSSEPGVGTLSSEPGVTWGLVVNGTSQAVTSAQVVHVPSEASLQLTWTLNGKTTVEQVATAPKACPPTVVTSPPAGGSAPDVAVEGEKAGRASNPPAVLPKTGASAGVLVAAALVMLLLGSALRLAAAGRR